MKKILIGLVSLAFIFSVFPYQAAAADCFYVNVCSINKNNFELRDIGQFKYLNWAYSSSKDAWYMTDSGGHTAVGVYHSLGYTIPGAPVVDYHASIMEFASKDEASKFLGLYLSEISEKEYKNSMGQAYRNDNENSNSIMWLHENLLLSIHTNNDAKNREEFLSQAFKVYATKYLPQKLGKKYLLAEKKAPSHPVYSPISFINPNLYSPALMRGKKLNIKWNSDKKEFPKVDLWITNLNDTSDYTYIATNLKNKGQFSWKIPKSIPLGPYQLSIGIPGESVIRSGITIDIETTAADAKKEVKDQIKKGKIKDDLECFLFANQFIDDKVFNEVFAYCSSHINKK